MKLSFNDFLLIFSWAEKIQNFKFLLIYIATII